MSGSDANPAPAIIKTEDPRKTILNSFPLNLKCLNLKENIGIRVIMSVEKSTVKKHKTILELTRLSINWLSAYSLAKTSEIIKNALPGVGKPLN